MSALVHSQQSVRPLCGAVLFGGGLVVMGIDDGRDPEEPVDVDNIKSIEFLTVGDRYAFQPNEIERDITAGASFGKPSTYFIRTGGSGVPVVEGTSPEIHADRLLLF